MNQYPMISIHLGIMVMSIMILTPPCCVLSTIVRAMVSKSGNLNMRTKQECKILPIITKTFTAKTTFSQLQYINFLSLIKHKFIRWDQHFHLKTASHFLRAFGSVINFVLLFVIIPFHNFQNLYLTPWIKWHFVNKFLDQMLGIG